MRLQSKNGDINKPCEGGPFGRITALNKWMELTDALNKDNSGTPKPMEKWKRVWSDLKNNTKRKASKIYKSAAGGGVGPACKLVLTDLEQRVINIIRSQPSSSIDMQEVDLEMLIPALQPANMKIKSPSPDNGQVESSEDRISTPPIGLQSNTFTENVAKATGVSPTAYHAHTEKTNPTKPRRFIRRYRSIPRRTRVRTDSIPSDTAQHLLNSDEHWRNIAQIITTEHFRLREIELERQAQWQSLFARGLDILENYLNK